MSSREDIKSLLAKCEELRVRSAHIHEYIKAQDEVRKIIYETNRTLINIMNGSLSGDKSAVELTDMPLIRESRLGSIIDNPNTDT